MDFGVVGLDGLVGSESGFHSDHESKQKWYGSVNNFHRQGRSASTEDDLRSSKLVKTDDYFTPSKEMLFQQRHSLLRSNGSVFSDGQEEQQMLSFSCPKADTLFSDKSCQNVSIPYFHSTSGFSRNTGYNYGNLNNGMMHGGLSGVRGPFTPSQWMELEHQALIYKYVAANVPVPSNLLIPIKKALDSAAFSTFSSPFLRPNALGWGSFHMGFSSNTDPEPGRCRRTDGKKWRCSRDAVADQKYCERHMNRGRHRSRKPVEGQTGHSVAGNSNGNATANLITSPSVSTGVSNSLAVANQQLKNLRGAQTNRMFMKEGMIGDRDAPDLSVLSSSASKSNSFLIQKQQIQCDQYPKTEFGLISSDFLLNPSQKVSHDINDRENESRLRQFIFPKPQSDRSPLSWPNFTRSDRTQLSISIPNITSSATNEKLTLSPLRLSREINPIQMGLGGSNVLTEANSRQPNWIPISWETSMGGPLGEVLHHTNNNGGDCKSSSAGALNLMTQGWDHSPPIGSSPTGVLQKTAFGSLSNSSTGSSPRAENNKTHEGASHCNDLLGQLL